MGSGNPQNILNMIIGAGQSLGIGGGGDSPVVNGSVAYSTRALMFALTGASGTGARAGLLNGTSLPISESTLDPTTLTGLTGILEAIDSNGFGETPGSGFLNRVNDALVHYMLFATLGVQSQAWAASTTGPGVAKGSQSYANILIAVKRAIALASSAISKSLIVRAATLTHGEEDCALGTLAAAYEADILTFQKLLSADIAVLTGQSQLVAVFLDQLSSWTMNSLTTSPIPGAQLSAALDNPDRIFLVTPKYFLPYEDGQHLKFLGYALLGEYYAKAYLQTIIHGVPWKPVYPIAFSLDDSTHIRITFNVPVGPLVLDTTLVSDPGKSGFEYTDGSSPPSISSVAIQNGNQVVLTMSGAITASAGGRTVRYAYTGTSGNWAGPSTGPRGTLHDSDPAISRLVSSPAAYNSGTTYAAGAGVTNGGVTWLSTRSSNTGHTPGAYDGNGQPYWVPANLYNYGVTFAETF